MTSLKVQDANEIAEAMAKALGDVEFNKIFRTASITKEAMGPAETELATFIAQCKAGQADNAAWAAMRNKFFGGGEGQGALAAELKQSYGEMNADSKVNYYIDAMDACQPASADDEQLADVSECSEGCKCPKCMGNMVDDRTALALDFAMGHLVKVADALDKKGFSGVAYMIDETIAKLAAKKSKKEEKEEKDSKKSKKEEKEEKDSKKSKKEEKEEKDSKKSKKESKKE